MAKHTSQIALETFFQPARSSYAVQGASETIKLTQARLAGTKHASDKDDPSREIDEADRHDDESLPKPVSRRPVPLSRTSDDLDGLDEDDLGEDEGDDEVSDPGPSRRPISSRPIPNPSRSRKAALQNGIIMSSTHRMIQQTRSLPTSGASWSPERKHEAAAVPPQASTKEARASLRERLKGYASQSGSIMVNVESEEEEEANDVTPEITTNGTEDRDENEYEEEASQPHDVVDDMMAKEGREHPISDRLDFVDGNEPERSIGWNLDGPLFEDETENIEELSEQPRTASTVSSSLSEGSQQEHPDSEFFPESGKPDPLEAPIRPPSGYRDESTSTTAQGELTLRFDLPRLRHRYSNRVRRPSSSSQQDAFATMRAGGVTSAAGINNKDSTTAEEALSRVISKTDFAKMQVLGQFNKGFIIARLRSEKSDDLFIIDQHASDEKFNFETLQRTTVIKAQSLIKPRPLQLTSGDEIVAMENLEILRSNGFEVDIYDDKAPGRGEKINLVAMPVSKDTTFDFKDLEQLLHILSDGARPAGQMVRCSKARAMFAMRACRRSVMIGKALTKGQMVNLLKNMGTIDQPWNCPHGRPTMRHLTKVEPVTQARMVEGRIDWSKRRG